MLPVHGLAYDLPRVLVIAKADEDRLSHDSARGPLVETDLHDYPRRDPVRRLVGVGFLAEGWGLPFETPQPTLHFPQRFRAETGAGVPGVDEVVAIVVAEQDGAEVLTAAARLGPPPHHELLRSLQLQLDPVVGALSGPVGRIDPLRDDPLPASTTRPRFHLLPIR